MNRRDVIYNLRPTLVLGPFEILSPLRADLSLKGRIVSAKVEVKVKVKAKAE